MALNYFMSRELSDIMGAQYKYFLLISIGWLMQSEVCAKKINTENLVAVKNK
jgi:hypothetical protein